MYEQPESPQRPNLALIGGALAIFLAAAGGTLLIITRPQQAETPATPQAEEAVESLPTASPVSEPETGPSVTPTAPPTPTPLPPYEHEVQSGETLYFIIQLYGYKTLDVVPAVLALNNLPSEDYVTEGTVLLIPRQTPTPAPTPDPNATLPPEGEGEAETGEAETAELPVGATSPAETGGDPDNRVGSPDGRFWIHTVREGETIASIARAYDSSVPCILRNNSFTYTAEGEPIIFVGQNLNVCIVVTLTPTPSPTGDPFNSTATPTPTLSPPLLLAPANGATFARGDDVTLRWVTTFPLNEEQRYLVIAQDLTNNLDFRITTTDNAFRLPDDLRPAIGQASNFEWRVVVLRGDTTDSPMVSGLGEPRQFTWGG